MNDLLQVIGGLIAFVALAAPIVGFVLFMRYINRKEKAVLARYQAVED